MVGSTDGGGADRDRLRGRPGGRGQARRRQAQGAAEVARQGRWLGGRRDRGRHDRPRSASGRLRPRRSRRGPHRLHGMRPRHLLLGAAAAVAGAALWWRKNPSACPYGQRFWVEAPHPLITRARLREILEPQAGERIVEIGPGTGYYTLEVAEWIKPDGQLEILDLQQKMLDHTMGRAVERGLANITPTQSDATSMPYEDG